MAILLDRGADFSGIYDINDPKNMEGMCPMIWAVTFNERKIAAELLRLSSKYVLHYPVVIERCLSIMSGNVTYYEDIIGEDENMFHLKRIMKIICLCWSTLSMRNKFNFKNNCLMF